MMLLRVHALYPLKRWITQSLAFILLIETGVNIWLISGAERKSRFPMFHLHVLSRLYLAQRFYTTQHPAYVVGWISQYDQRPTNTFSHQPVVWYSTQPRKCIARWFSRIQVKLTMHQRSVAAAASAWIPLLYDTIVFGLTLWRTVPPIRKKEASYIIKRLLEDGLLYYRYVCTGALTIETHRHYS